MQGTSMEGPIPSSISQLKNLTQLILRNCVLTGPIPQHIGDFTGMKILDLSNNRLSGEKPTKIESLIAMEYKQFIDISYNNFSKSSAAWCLQSIVNLVSSLSSSDSNTSKHCPIWYGYGGGLKWLEHFSYINSIVYLWTSIPLIASCTLPAICLLTGKFIVPEISNYASIVFMALFICIAATCTFFFLKTHT